MALSVVNGSGYCGSARQLLPEVLADPKPSRFFTGVNIEKLKIRIGAFFAMAMGWACRIATWLKSWHSYAALVTKC